MKYKLLVALAIQRTIYNVLIHRAGVEHYSAPFVLLMIDSIHFFVAVIIAVWRYGASVRSEQAMESYRETSLKFENILKFMRVITDNQPTEIFAVTEHGEYTFANLTASENAGTTAQDMMGKSMTSVVGPIKAKLYSETNKDVIENFEPAHRVYRSGENEDLQVIRASHLPLRADDNYPRGALVVADDISLRPH